MMCSTVKTYLQCLHLV